MSRSSSLDSRLSSALSSGQLAESALSNLRKSLATQRSNGMNQSQPDKASTPVEGRPKTKVEERLRAATSNALSGHPKAPSTDGTPGETTSNPESIALPDSPVISPTLQPVDIFEDPVTPLKLPSPPSPAGEASCLTPDPGHDIEAPLNEGNSSIDESSIANAAVNSTDVTSNVYWLQDRSRQVEQRFIDISASFKKLQAEKAKAELVLQEFLPLKSLEDPTALRECLRNISVRTEAFENEIKRLNDKLEAQEDQLEELTVNHRSASVSQLDQIEKLQIQLAEAEALVAVGQEVDAQTEKRATEKQAKIEKLQQDLERAQGLAKEEEEKRVKAISLLKSVRQKLVKAEKDRDDAVKELSQLKEKDRLEKDQEGAENARLRNEVEATNRAKEKAIADLHVQFEKDVGHMRDLHEKEMSSLRGQFELEIATARSVHDHELAQKTSHITFLEKSLNDVTKDKNGFFDSLQLRQAELESAQSHLESLQSQNMELLYQLREVEGRYALLKEDLAEVKREQEVRLPEPDPSVDEVALLLSATEARYEAKLSGLKRQLDQLEKDRNDNEAEWSQKLREKNTEVDELKKVIGTTAWDHQRHEEVLSEMKGGMVRLEGEKLLLQERIGDLQKSHLEAINTEKLWKSQELELSGKINILEQQVEESKQQEAKTRIANKTLREELRKVQSSAALLERQRNPGMSIWSSTREENSPGEQYPSTNASSGPESPATAVASSISKDEVSLEYIRNVILQFLEHKEMRPNLVKVLSTILRFTPQETRRLVAKV